MNEYLGPTQRASCFLPFFCESESDQTRYEALNALACEGEQKKQTHGSACRMGRIVIDLSIIAAIQSVKCVCLRTAGTANFTEHIKCENFS